MSINVLKGVVKTLMTKEPDVPNTPITDKNFEEIRDVVRSVIVGITMRKITEILSISHGLCETIFTNISGFRRIAVKFVPKSLNFDQKQNRENIVEQQMSAEVTCDPDIL